MSLRKGTIRPTHWSIQLYRPRGDCRMTLKIISAVRNLWESNIVEM